MTDSEQMQERINAFFKEWEAIREKYKADFNATITSDQLGDQTLAFVNNFLRLYKVDLVIRPQIQLVTDPNWQPSAGGDADEPPGEPKQATAPPRPPIPAKRSRKNR